jgi:DNA polymerase I-like protein with 3'-5' exonuclease and polymerase domains/intein/homing endonuclease
MEISYKVITTSDELRAAVDELRKHPVIGFDTETTALDPYEGRVRLVQLSTPEGFTYIVDLDSFRSGDLRTVESLEPLRKLLAARQPVKIAHNAKFDAKWIRHYLGAELGGDYDSRTCEQKEVERGGLFDTLLASQIVSAGDTEDRHSLQVVVERYLNEEMDKSAQLSDWSGELSASQLEYAARDAAILIPLRERLVERIKADSLGRVAQLEFECVAPISEVELAGVFLDVACWREQIAVVQKKRAVLAEELQSMLAEGASQGLLFADARVDINLDSHTQLSAALKRLGVPLPDSTRNWKLQPLAADYPVIAKLLEYRTVQKSLTSYGENIINEISPRTGRIHANFHQIGAPTGRMACLAGDTLIPTTHGLKRMSTIVEGDRVKTSYGFKRVERAWTTGVRQLYRIRLRDGRSIRATGDHRFLTGRADTWRRLDELQAGGMLYVSLKIFDVEGAARPCPINVALPEVRARKTVTLPDSLSTELCELMGLIIADGFLGRRHERPVKRRRLSGTPALYDRICLAFDWQDKELTERIVDYSVRLFGHPFVKVKARTCQVFQLPSTVLAHFFAALGLEGSAHTKAVPEIILGASAFYQAAFLRGLFEGDGHRTESSVGLTSVNYHLLTQVQLMLSTLGLYSTIKRRNDTSGFAGSARFDLKIHKKSDLAKFLERVGFMSTRKNWPFHQSAQPTDGIATPFIIPGAQLYRDAVAAGTAQSSREGIKPFGTFYKGHYIKDESVKKLVGRFGMLPSLKPVVDYLDVKLRPVEIESITPDGVEEVYDITVEDVHEFIANGIVVHNCTNPNVQQVPHAVEYRRCFRAPEGRKLVIADYSQIELRILADFTGDDGFINAFNSGADLHRVTAAQVFNVPLAEVTADQRSFAKRLNFGVVYGIGAQRFSMMTGLSQTESEDLLRRYFATYRALDTWLRDAALRALRERSARTASGRLARFNFDPADKQAASSAQRNGKNTPIQGSSADILKRALRLLHDKLRGTNACIVNMIHDEIVVEADEAQAGEISKIVEDAMCEAGEEYVKKVPVKVETEVADAWVK